MKQRSIMPGMHCPRWLVSLTILLLSGCSSFGPARIPADHVGYNEAVARAANEQMLLNLVRLRYQHVPVFLAVNSVLTQYTYIGEAGVAGSRESAVGDVTWSVGGNAAVLYAERPTVTFAPLSGEEFAKQLLSPIPSDRLFSLVQSGWSAEQLLIMGLEQINHVENLPFHLTPSQENLDQVRTFHRMIGLIMELARRRVVEVRNDETGKPANRFLVFEAGADQETKRLVDEFKRLCKLAPEYSMFRVTTNLTRRKPDEVIIRQRSLLALMGFISRGVEVPESHLREGRAIEISVWADEEARALLFPLRVHCSEERPNDAFVAVQYEGHWFYLKRSDHFSKSAFSLLAYLFQLQAPVTPSTGPIITVPAGG